MNDTLDTIAAHALAAWIAAICATRRGIRILHAVLLVTRRHVPAWVGTLLTVCLMIPGPVDELIVLAVIAVYVAVKPVMRAELGAAIRTA